MGLHRDPDAPAVTDAETQAHRAEDHQDAELVRIASYAGLRRGELVALRWRDVDFLRRKITVRRAVSANVDADSTFYCPECAAREFGSKAAGR
jgi:integrase